ncbi:hypothetical protein D9M72_480120 [compost metagenome]
MAQPASSAECHEKWPVGTTMTSRTSELKANISSSARRTSSRSSGWRYMWKTMGGPEAENSPPSTPESPPMRAKLVRPDTAGSGLPCNSSSTAQIRIDTPSRPRSHDTALPLSHTSSMSPTMTPTVLPLSAGFISCQGTGPGRARK